MKRIKIIGIIVIILGIAACSKMDDNYRHYLDKNTVYSPKISNLMAQVGLKQASLTWDNPPGNIAQKILIDYQDDSLWFDTMIDSVFLDSLEIKGYTISIFTIDEFDNYSVPTSIQIFPNGEK